MDVFYAILLIAACICFLLAALRVAVMPKLDLIALGLLAVALVWAIQHIDAM